MTTTAQRTWEAENSIITVDPSQNALYNLPAPTEYKALQEAHPWRSDPNYFTSVRISALALLKMTIHARSGGNIEVMGLMTGYVTGRSFIITDAFRLPVEGTETRVNAASDADEYIVNFGELSRNGGGQQENPVGWYHSHPGYGCWLSGIDVATERLQQVGNDPFCAVVIDPDRTISAGKVEIGAFRTYPEGSKHSNNVPFHEDDDFQTIPSGKIEDFGAHANDYYSLEVSHFKSTLDTHLLNLLWNKYWTSTLGQSPLYTNRDYATKQIIDHASKTRIAADHIKRASGPAMTQSRKKLVASTDGEKNIKVTKDPGMEKLVRTGDRIANEEVAGLLAGDVKHKLFWGVIEEARIAVAKREALDAATGQAAAANGGELSQHDSVVNTLSTR
jgi:COP9 signalosome complex subunit 5